MKVKIYGNCSNTNDLFQKVNFAIDELGLNDFINTEMTSEESLKSELNISKEPALIIEEESIDFKDIIFEGIVPEIDELKSMFVSIIGGGGSSCSSGLCGVGCSCG